MKELKYGMFLRNIDKKNADNASKIIKIPSICVWSDLLGFSNDFISSSWKPSDNQWFRIAKRLKNAQNICANNLSYPEENVLVSNDAFIRNLNLEAVNHMDNISMWLRNIIFSHMSINSCEQDNNYPGMRTIISGGERLIHNYFEATHDDYIYSYTKPDSETINKSPARHENYTIMYNHAFMQMNTAFSKSYILDSAGSKHGIAGNKIYIDESVFETLRLLMTRYKISSDMFIDVENDKTRLIAIKKPHCTRYYLGLEVEKDPININLKNLHTKVYRLLSFFPWDEEPAIFKIEVDHRMEYQTEPIVIPDNL